MNDETKRDELIRIANIVRSKSDSQAFYTYDDLIDFFILGLKGEIPKGWISYVEAAEREYDEEWHSTVENRRQFEEY